MDTRTASDEPKTVETNLEGYRFTYYRASGGMVVSRDGRPIDAGVIGTPGAIEPNRLRAIAHEWWKYRREYEIVRDLRESRRRQLTRQGRGNNAANVQ